jgi:hypothetical protein
MAYGAVFYRPYRATLSALAGEPPKAGRLCAESYALLIGSIGTFVILALVMFLTRKFDWYGRE